MKCTTEFYYYILLKKVPMNFQQTYQLKSTPTLRSRLHNYGQRMEDRSSPYNSPPCTKTKTIINELESFRTHRFSKQNQVINGLPMQSYPKLQYLRNCLPRRAQFFQHRFVKTESCQSPTSIQSSSAQKYFKDDQVTQGKTYQSRKDPWIGDQYQDQSFHAQKRIFSEQILPKSMILPLGKSSHDVTFSMQPREVEQDKKSSSTSQSDSNNILQDPATPKKQIDASSGSGYSNLKKKLAQNQIKAQEQLYRSLIRSSSREGNVCSKQQLKKKMKVVLDKIYSLKQLLKP